MNDRIAVPTPPPHPDVWYGPNDFAPGSGPNFAVWMCTSSNGSRTVLWIQKTLSDGNIFSAFDYICDGPIGVPWLGDNSFVALHGTQTGAGNWPDVVFLYGVNSYTSSAGDLDICFPDEEYAKGYRTAINMGNDQTIVYPPNSSPQAGRRYCYDGTPLDLRQFCGVRPPTYWPAHLPETAAWPNCVLQSRDASLHRSTIVARPGTPRGAPPSREARWSAAWRHP